ncbi:MAG: hypothetical protein GQ570_04190 [Helicobacteraceae bacterium]|nr:hypothetical protein [Helicobacteraceae bacterium]
MPTEKIIELDETKKYISALVNQLCELAFHSYSIGIPKQVRKILIEKSLNHYSNHVNEFNVTVNGLDPYKFLAWSGIELYAMVNDEVLGDMILNCTIISLRRALEEDGKQVTFGFIKKLKKMIKKEFMGESDLGLGKNGLYVAFRMASLAEYVDGNNSE